MKDYSADAFKMAMCSHFCRYGMPAVLTADNGSQIWKGWKGSFRMRRQELLII